MIIGLPEIITTLGIAAFTELHNFIKGHAQAQKELINDQQTYCPPVLKIPDDMPAWKIDIYNRHCKKGMEQRLQTKVKELKLLAPITPDPSPIQIPQQ